MCSFQFLQGIYIRNLNKKKDAVIGQKDGYVLRLTRAFTRQLNCKIIQYMRVKSIII